MAKDDAVQWERFSRSVAEELHFILWEGQFEDEGADDDR